MNRLAPRSLGSGASRPQLLIVDDEYAIRFSLENYFTDRGFLAATAGNIDDALDLLKQRRFDAVLVDIRLPDGSGEALISVAQSRDPRLKFLIYTGSVDYRLSPALRSIGIRDEQVLIKPVAHLSELIDRVNALLNKTED